MPAILTPFTEEQIAAFRAGDERTFERIVRARFEALTERAHIVLGNDSLAAPRVATSVLLSAWQDRAEIVDSAALDRYLDDEVPRRCTDERRRRASLHRFEVHEGVHVSAPPTAAGMTADQAWDEIALRLHVSAEELEEHREEARLLARQHAHEHVKQIGKGGVPWGMVAIGVGLLAIAVVGMRYVSRNSAEMALTRALNGDEVRVLSAGAGQRGTITLLDDSEALLAAGSTLRIPSNFGQSVRGVGLDGSARFKVAPNGSRDFQVRTRNIGIIAVGTEFDVRAYGDEDVVLVRVTEGRVNVHPIAGASASHTVNAGEALAIGTDGQIRTPSADELVEAFSWTDGSLVLRAATLDHALTVLRRWHDVNAQLADPAMGSNTVTVELPLESAAMALNAFTRAANLAVDYNGQQMVLRAVSPDSAPGVSSR